MSFMPRMTAQTHALRVTQPLSWRRWEGVVADVWHAQSDQDGHGFYVSPDPRLIVFLGGQETPMQLRSSQAGEWQSGVGAFYIPAGMPLWSQATQAQDYAHLDLHLQAGPFQRRLAEALPHAARDTAEVARFLPKTAELSQLGTMLAAQVERPSRPDMMMDGLLSALLCEVFDLAYQAEAPARGGISPVSLRKIESFVQEHMETPLTVAQLAALAGLSESWFPRAFKQSTGQTPQRWLAAQRVEKAARMMRESSLSLADIAASCGFADQAHLSRVFRSVHGLPPARWRRQF